MQLFVRGRTTHTLQLTGNENVNDLKTKLAEAEGVQVSELALYAAGEPLADNAQLNSCTELSTLDLEVRLLGGKVHGSLARAGKVKGQTPKVDKQEKKKKKTGRAKRRLQYNRRFVNVVSTFGRRKGPNSNS
ncbi:DgyrCDS416 [Dimorphilus gyrociliatus]|uniref:DgyrCDS416 n=1 Tax=Dimorphilus gyrociliatus TaxID=2664684 RepID=A0A7I8V798_9ANNE|nr:DgyrCDS416 [Dimorphilus gyrociliatus]